MRLGIRSSVILIIIHPHLHLDVVTAYFKLSNTYTYLPLPVDSIDFLSQESSPFVDQIQVFPNHLLFT